MNAIATSTTQLRPRRLRSVARSRGMTLIEIMIVVAIISLIVGGIGTVAIGRMNQARIDMARNNTVQLQQSVEQYMVMKKGKCPKTIQDLKAAGIISKIEKDPWGNDYVMVCPGEKVTGSADISSIGPDGEANTPDDIHSWDEEPTDDPSKSK